MPIDELKLKQILSKTKDLPTLPDVVAKVMKAVSNPMATANDLNAIISMDQALTSKVLRLANSAYYGFPQEITNMTQAVTILGFNTIRNLALSVSVHKMLFSGNERDLFSHREFWKHSVATAVAAKMLAQRAGYKSLENAFTAGLMHDIGKNIFDQFMHEEFMEALKVSKNEGIPLRIAEEKLIGMDHAAMGALLAEKWNLPKELREAIAWHHEPKGRESSELLISIVHAANELAREAEVGSGGDGGPIALDDEAAKLLKIVPGTPEFDAVKVDLGEHMQEAESFLKMTRD